MSTKQLSSESGAVSRGAGSILRSNLATDGYQIPCAYVLTEEEERSLYNIEVRIRLGQHDIAKDLVDALYDFPAEALLARTGLLEAILDLLGSVGFSTDSCDLGYDLISTSALSPQLAMFWCKCLLQSLCRSWGQLVDGGLCSSGFNDLSMDTSSSPSHLAQTMLNLRYPSLPAPVAESRRESQVSVPGFAIACCSAALPLLMRSNSAGLLHELSRLINFCLPLVLEPGLCRLEGQHVPLCEIERIRLQHICDRIEQVFVFYGSPPDLENYYGRKPEIISKSVAYDICAIGISVDIFSWLSPSYFSCHSCPLKLGPNSVLLLARLCLADLGVCSGLDALLLAVDPQSAQNSTSLRAIFNGSFELIEKMRTREKIEPGHAIVLARWSVSFIELSALQAEGSAVQLENMCFELIEAVVYLFGTLSTHQVGDSDALMRSFVLRLLICRSLPFVDACIGALSALLISHPASCLVFKGRLSDPDAAQTINTNDVLRSLCRAPDVLHILLVSRVIPGLHGNTPSADTGSSIAWALSSLLCEGVVNSVEMQVLPHSHWDSLLHPLYLTLSLQMEESLVTTSSAAALLLKLEDFYLRSGCKLAVYKGLLMGIFSTYPNVRIISLTKLSSLLSGGGLTAVSDPFPPRAPLRLESTYPLAQQCPENRSAGFTHSDTKKLAGVAFGNYDVGIRIIALRQLGIRIADRALLLTADIVWVRQLAILCAEVLKTINWNVADSFVDAPAELCLECAILLESLVTEDKRLRLSMSIGLIFAATDEFVDISFMLSPFLLGYNPGDDPSGLRRSIAGDVLFSIYGRVLSLWVLGSDNWELLVEDSVESYVLADGSLPRSSSTVILPSFLVGHYGLTSLSSTHIARSDVLFGHLIKEVSCNAATRTLHGVVGTGANVLSTFDFVRANSLKGESSISRGSACIGASVILAISSAQSHRELRQALLLGRLMQQHSELSRATLLTSLGPSLRKLFEVAPRNDKDLTTLVTALPLVTDLLLSDLCVSPSAFLPYNIADIVTTLAPVLRAGYQLKGIETSKQFPTKLDIQLCILDFFSALFTKDTHPPYSYLLRASLPPDLVRLVSNETAAVHLRVSAVNLLRQLIRFGIWPSLQEPAGFLTTGSPVHQSTSSLGELMRVVSLLRAPDSSRCHAVVIGCLQLLLCGSDGIDWMNGKDWRMLLRLVHDRRSTTRFLAMQLCIRLFKASETQGCRVEANQAQTCDSLRESICSVMCDSFESPLVRITAARTLIIKVRNADDLPAILACCCSVLDNMSESCTAAALDIILMALSEFPIEAMITMKGLKLLPFIVSLLRDKPEHSRVRALSRVRTGDGSQYGTNEELRLSFLETGLVSVWRTHCASQVKHSINIKAATARLIHCVSNIDSEFITQSPVYIEIVVQAVRNLIGLSVTSIHRDVYCSLADFISAAISKEDIETRAQFLDGSFAFGMLQTTVKCLAVMLDFDAQDALPSRSLHLITAAVRLSSLLIETKEYRIAIGIGGCFEGSPVFTKEAREFFCVLLRLRVLVADDADESHHHHCVLYKLDLVVALFMKHSWSARLLMISDSNLTPAVMFLDVLRVILRRVYTAIPGSKDYAFSALKLLKSKSPSKGTGTSHNKFIQCSPQSVVSMPLESKWRKKARGYVVKEESGSLTEGSICTDLSPTAALLVGSALSLIQHLVSDCKPAREKAYELGLQEILGHLLRLSSTWATIRRSAEKNSYFMGILVPTHIDLAGLALSAVSSCLATTGSGDLRAFSGLPSKVLHISSASAGVSLSQILTLGLNKDTDVSLRMFALLLTARAVSQGSSKSSIVLILNDHLLRCLQSASSATLVFSLEVYLAYLAHGEAVASHSTGVQPLDFPEIIRWITDRHMQCVEVVCCILRAVGRMSQSSSRRMQAIAVNADTVSFLLTCRNSCKHPAIKALVALSLLCVCRLSEQAVSQVRAFGVMTADVTRSINDSSLSQRYLDIYNKSLDSLNEYIDS